MVSISKVSFRYPPPNDIDVLDSISLSVPKGNVGVLLGPSGSGKSTLLKIIASLLPPSQGSITFDTIPTERLKAGKDLAFVFQDPTLLPHLTVAENIALPGKIGKQKGTYADLEKLLATVGLTDYRDFHSSDLSGGMKSRVNLARALYGLPVLLLLDEPFAALDLLTRTKLIVEFNQIIRSSGVTALMVTHSIEEAVFIADTIFVLSHRPATIIERLDIDFGTTRDMSLFDQAEFIDKVKICRKLLLQQI